MSYCFDCKWPSNQCKCDLSIPQYKAKDRQIMDSFGIRTKLSSIDNDLFLLLCALRSFRDQALEEGEEKVADLFDRRINCIETAKDQIMMTRNIH